MMAKYDPIITNGDKVMGSDGNYVKSDTCLGRIARSASAKRDRWPAGHGYALGCRVHERLPLKHTEENERLVESDYVEAEQPWVDDRRLLSVDAHTEYTNDGQPVCVVTAVDAAKRLDLRWPTGKAWTL